MNEFLRDWAIAGLVVGVWFFVLVLLPFFLAMALGRLLGAF
jgi:lauroyl/myristoyl acyltransferase